MQQLRELEIELSSEEDFQKSVLELVSNSETGLKDMYDTGELDEIPYNLDFLAEEIINSKVTHTKFDGLVIEVDSEIFYQDMLPEIFYDIFTESEYTDILDFISELVFDSDDYEQAKLIPPNGVTLKEYYDLCMEHDSELDELVDLLDYDNGFSISLEGIEFYSENKDKIKELLESDASKMTEEEDKMLETFYEYIN